MAKRLILALSTIALAAVGVLLPAPAFADQGAIDLATVSRSGISWEMPDAGVDGRGISWERIAF